MLWLARVLKIDERTIILACGLCANTVRHLMKDQRSIDAVDGAIAYGRGEISKEELAELSRAADAAAYAADAAYAAADAATYAAADVAVAIATAAAVYAAYAAADAVYAAYKENQQQTADICREILTGKVLEKISEL